MTGGKRSQVAGRSKTIKTHTSKTQPTRFKQKFSTVRSHHELREHYFLKTMTSIQVAASYLHLYREEILEICGSTDMRLITRRDGHLHLLLERKPDAKEGYDAKLIKKYLEKQLNVCTNIYLLEDLHPAESVTLLSNSFSLSSSLKNLKWWLQKENLGQVKLSPPTREKELELFC
jgi:hypothetical protein